MKKSVKKYQEGGKKRLTLSKASLTKIKNAQNNVAPKTNIVGELMTGPAKAAGAIIVQGSTGKMLISAAKKLLSKAPKGKLEREIAGRTTNVIARDMAKNTELQQVAKKTAALAKKSYAKKMAKNPNMKFKKGGKKLHLGFKETQAKIAKKQGISMEAAGAILANSARKAGPQAVKKNPALLNVKRGTKKFGDGGKNNTSSDTNKRFVFSGTALEPSKQSPETMQKSRPVKTKESPQKLGFRKGGKKR